MAAIGARDLRHVLPHGRANRRPKRRRFSPSGDAIVSRVLARLVQPPTARKTAPGFPVAQAPQSKEVAGDGGIFFS
ncbi:hypothetical protein C0Z18_13820 [Trinickia dabaoshanensis]|uniref:Uncharacterized protein n=1 Tax=Trinickia dabaoshanensis TaxID=564714 RepID=A0A2N7VQI8_9BURK|nr:hypothetical protein [Trinickia dabaoshanensis]PMS19397.1 hypothetical protein C0Z18_13820 [Trinickia dabaoshanensis]